ncbi:MAG TPA: DUF2202 domain-containing protein [Nocardioides sp.]|uniref:DUF2202 domain-containing protein n=1 Tax=Nocardioides sp. TaxID=35761 RepID=UPI002C308536|nr:DUF2202 domain-containing protein [Nocardioides sp.]HQR25629.1 DUF2202 domain-containing protein [Nocardioides sp.]
MRASRLTTMLASAAVLAVLAGGAAVATSGLTRAPVPGAASTTDSAVLAERLAFNREEERMARDLYRFFARRYDNARPFGMIARSEQQHFTAVGVLLARYGVADPSAGLPAGSYADPTVQQLYDGWKKQGTVSLRSAFRAGQELEKRDIADLEATLAQVGEPDVQTVLGHLLAASRMHLRAFTAALVGGGVGPMMRGPGAGGAFTGGAGPGGGGRWGVGGRWGAGGRPCPMMQSR